MYRVSKKLLMLWLSLLLGISPLHGAMAEIFTPSGKYDSVHQMASMPANTVAAAPDHGFSVCEQGDSHGCCGGSDCPSSQCTACVLAVATEYPRLLRPGGSIRIFWIDDSFVNEFSSSLYRPPKA